MVTTEDDPIGLRFHDDPYPRYAELRRESPVVFFEPTRTWWFFRHADVNAVLRSRAVGTVPFAPRTSEPMPAFSSLMDGQMLKSNPPDHTRLRALVSPWFLRGRLDAFRPIVREITEQLIRPQQLDFAADVAMRIPPSVLAAALGIPESDVYLLQPWSAAMVRYWEIHHEPDTAAKSETAAAEIGKYVGDLIRQRHKRPGDDVLSHLIQSGLSDHETVVMAVLLLNAGHETTVYALGNALLALMTQREAWQRLVANPSIAAKATEELLRFDTSVQTFPRRLIEETVVAGHHLAPGDDVRVVFGSANRDEAIFSEPERLDLTRDPNPQISFGVGIHTCLGAPLARIEIAEVVGVLARLRPNLELAGDPVRKPGMQIRGLLSLPVE